MRSDFSLDKVVSERVLPWQVTMDQLMCASLSDTHHYWLIRKIGQNSSNVEETRRQPVYI